MEWNDPLQCVIIVSCIFIYRVRRVIFVGSGLHGRECAWLETFGGSLAGKQISSRKPCKYSLMNNMLKLVTGA